MLGTQSFKALKGVVAVNKPRGVVSKDVSRIVQKGLHDIKIGHVGTLDPMAEGVLVLVIGTASRLQDYLVKLEKEYVFDLELGRETDSLDSEGELIKEMPIPSVSSAKVQSVINSMLGCWEQTPPIYSAIKYKGKPLYSYARSGRAHMVPLADLKKIVEIRELELTSVGAGRLTFRLSCSQGTYVRAVGKAIADALGTCGTVTRIVRTRAAGVSVSDCHSLSYLEKNLSNFSNLIRPIGDLPIRLPRWKAVDSISAERLLMGQRLSLDAAAYHGGVSYAEGVDQLGEVLLLNDSGTVFGLGLSSSDSSGRILLAMRRSL